MEREEVKEKLEEVGNLPGIRVGAADHAMYAAGALYGAGMNRARTISLSASLFTVYASFTPSRKHLG